MCSRFAGVGRWLRSAQLHRRAQASQAPGDQSRPRSPRRPRRKSSRYAPSGAGRRVSRDRRSSPTGWPPATRARSSCEWILLGAPLAPVREPPSRRARHTSIFAWVAAGFEVETDLQAPEMPAPCPLSESGTSKPAADPSKARAHRAGRGEAGRRAGGSPRSAQQIQYTGRSGRESAGGGIRQVPTAGAPGTPRRLSEAGRLFSRFAGVGRWLRYSQFRRARAQASAGRRSVDLEARGDPGEIRGVLGTAAGGLSHGS